MNNYSGKWICLVITVVALTGCAGTKTNSYTNYSYGTSDRFDIEIVNSTNATAAGLKVFEGQLGKRSNELTLDSVSPNRKVTIEFTNYYVRHGATRALVGVFAGSDNVTTLTTITDSNSGEELGQVEHVTRNPTAVVGINDLIEGHANKIVNFLLSKESE